MEKTEDLIYVDLPTLTLFWWPRKYLSYPARWRPSVRIALLGIVHLQTFVKLHKAKTCRILEHRLLICWKMLKMCLSLSSAVFSFYRVMTVKRSC